MKKKLVRINTSITPLLDAKPPKELRPKCLQCDGTITLLKTRWYDTSIPWSERPTKYVYDGVSYFCCRNCALTYAHNKAEEELNIPKLNNI